MKKIFVLLLILPYLFSCSSDKEDEIPPTTLLPKEEKILNALEDFKVYPNDKKNINYLGALIDSVSYKLVAGRKNNKAWISKFNANGDEIFSFELDADIPDMKFGHYNYNSILLATNELIFLRGLVTDIEDLNDNYWLNEKFKQNAIFSVLNATTGKEMTRLTNNNNYVVEKETESFLIIEKKDYSTYLTLNMIGADGSLLWKRPTVKADDEDHFSEYNSGMSIYGNHKFLDTERMIFVGHNNFKIINLKNYKLLKEINLKDYPFNGDKKGEQNIDYIWDYQPYIKDNEIHLNYYERYVEKVKDEISENISYKKDTIGIYQYGFDKQNYNFLYHKKISQ